MTSDALHSITYVSTATEPLSRPTLEALLVKSRDNNVRDRITGLLLYADGSFMQTIEGPPDTLHALFARIERDPTHRGLITRFNEAVPERAFTDWAMGFRNVGKREPGYSDFMDDDKDVDNFFRSHHAAKNLLASFRSRLA